MAQFIIALAAFFVLHVVPSRAGIRENLVSRYGERPYSIVYSLLSIILISWVIVAALQAPTISFWITEIWHYDFAIYLMPFAFIFFVQAIGTPNPLSVAFTNRPYDPANPGVVAITRHPVLWSFGLWGLAHIPANGDLVSLIFFGCMTVFAFAGMKRMESKKRAELGDVAYQHLMTSTSTIPFHAILAGRASFPLSRRMALRVGFAIVAYVLFLVYGHIWLIGADPLAFY